MWSFAALSALRLDTTDDLLHTSFRTSGYLTSCRLSGSSNPSAHSALNFGISKTIKPQSTSVEHFWAFFLSCDNDCCALAYH